MRGTEERVCRLRLSNRLGPARLAARTGLAASTVHKILVRNGLNRLSWIDRPTGRVIRRYERPEPGDLVHLDVKKVGRIPPGGGVEGPRQGQRSGPRHPPPSQGGLQLCARRPSTTIPAWPMSRRSTTRPPTRSAGSSSGPRVWFRSIGIATDEVISDNGANFRSKKFAAQLARRAIAHTFCRPYRPQTNGKAERFNRTLADEFLYAYKFRSEPDRRRRLQTWIHHYNLHRHHTAINGTPASRVHNLYGFYT